uniref:Serine/threonine-protein kinase ATM-like n=1 Tax=Rhizophora mucronata TaxID=61149 RepID=A0A2P2KQC1_RHIMU
MHAVQVVCLEVDLSFLFLFLGLGLPSVERGPVICGSFANVSELAEFPFEFGTPAGNPSPVCFPGIALTESGAVHCKSTNSGPGCELLPCCSSKSVFFFPLFGTVFPSLGTCLIAREFSTNELGIEPLSFKSGMLAVWLV